MLLRMFLLYDHTIITHTKITRETVIQRKISSKLTEFYRSDDKFEKKLLRKTSFLILFSSLSTVKSIEKIII